MTTETINAESRAVEKFEIFESVPADAQEVLRVRPSRHAGEELQDIVVSGVYPDLAGYWDVADGCWYLWNAGGKPVDWKIHTDAIRLAGGILEWVKPAAVNVNPSGRAPTGWHFPN